jgi:DNA/RNA-binding domain of Phe-tRNA-synthetase-like protein
MKDFKEILKRLKFYLKNDKKVKIYDKDVAIALGITQMNFATIKRRNTIPYENILIFCKKEGICCNDIFFK